MLYWRYDERVDTVVARGEAALKLAARTAYIPLLIGAVALLFYALIAPVAAPRLAQHALDRLGSTSEWRVRAERIDFEPFALAFLFEDVQVAHLDEDIAVEAGDARADFSVLSLFSASPILDRLDIRDGVLRPTPRTASAFWWLWETLVTDSRITALQVEGALAGPDAETRATFEVHGADLELAVGRGALKIAASNGIGHESRFDAELAAQRSGLAAVLHGSARVTRVHLARGSWRLAAPDAVLAVDANLSAPNVTASFALRDGSAFIVDENTAGVRFELRDGGANASWGPGGLHVSATGSLAAGGRVQLGLTRPANGPERLTAHLDDVPAGVLERYALRALGAEPTSGTISIDVARDARDADVASFARLEAHNLRLVVDGSSAATVLALLEEPDGTVAMQIPLQNGRGAAEQIVAYVAERVAAVGAAPFAALAALVGGDAAALAAIEFVPGTAEPTQRGAESIAALATALSFRSRVAVRVDASVNSELDRAALARSQVVLHVSLATAQAERAPNSTAIDMASPRTQDVLDEFAGERLADAALDEVRALFPFDAAAPPAAPERVAYYRAVFDALVAREHIGDAALRRLANFRERTLQRLLTDMGVADSRVLDSTTTPTQVHDAFAVLPLALEPAVSHPLP